MFENFPMAFPPEGNNKNIIDVPGLVKFVETEIGVQVPAEVIAFWARVGTGFLGDRVLYVFGGGITSQP
ncbi:MAG: hypothetical protein WA071_24820 [Undibacterium umbellatum]|uniref:hypothetical protein n=1 Tax=Undibacterium umbellatum TaxID=2762300 RepID=UPI003BB68D51